VQDKVQSAEGYGKKVMG